MGKRLRRRAFLRLSGASAVGASLPLVLEGRASAAGYGALVPDPADVLSLPAGFSYKILQMQGDPMDDGYRVPGKPDGMFAFAGPNGALVLMRNHEQFPGDIATGPYAMGQQPPPEAYDPLAMGGVTRLVVDATTLERVSSNLVLAGTTRNCAGGPSPWGWFSCEEDVSPNHGYVFLCSTDATSVQPPQRIVSYGRFNHEAVAFDPVTNIAYMTEDRSDGCLYRFAPTVKDMPFDGKLQAMKVVGQPGLDTSKDVPVGQVLDVEWVDIDDPDPVTDDIRKQAAAKGAALLNRAEGAVFAEGAVWIASTNGGPVGAGQVFRMTPGADGDKFELLAQSPDKAVLENPDNITVAPSGEVFLVEDGTGGNFIRGVSPEGVIFDFARPKSFTELAGVCFAPDGKTMFFNMLTDGLTVAVTGPFGAASSTSASSASSSSASGSGGAGGADVTGAVAASGAGALGRDVRGIAMEGTGCNLAGADAKRAWLGAAAIGGLAGLALGIRRRRR